MLLLPFIARIKMSVCNISESLQLADSEAEEITQTIVGTRVEDLSQIYNGRIIIHGTLSLKNVVSDLSLMQPIDDSIVSDAPQQTTKITVGGQAFDLSSIPNNFWMKTLDQVIRCASSCILLLIFSI